METSEIEDEIYDCTRVAHLGLAFHYGQLNPRFINPASEVVDDGDEDIENQIINNFTPAENEDPASEPPPVPSVPHQATIDALETLLYSPQSDRNTRRYSGKDIELRDMYIDRRSSKPNRGSPSSYITLNTKFL